MPPYLLLLCGVAVLLVTFYDLCRTTVSVTGAGPITTSLASPLWHLARWVHGAFDTPWLLKPVGPCLAILLLVMWVALSWLGWWLIFSSNPAAVVNSTSFEAASPAERAYFVGFTITTLGYGDFVPFDSAWRLVAIITAINGFSLFTLAVTYWLSIVSAVVKKRKLARSISLLGQSPTEILTRTRGQGDFAILGNKVETLVQDIVEVGQQQRAYPILRYYHADSAKEALPVSLARFYLSLQIVAHACPIMSTSAGYNISMGIDAMEDFLHNLHEKDRGGEGVSFHEHMERGLDLPNLDKSSYEIASFLDSLPAKPLLSTYLAKEGWQWSQVWHLNSRTE